MCAHKSFNYQKGEDPLEFLEPCGFREISIQKPPHSVFGMMLCTVNNHLYVARVEMYTPEFTLTPAYRAGLHFGDRIDVINGRAVNGSSEVGPLYRLLKESGSVTLDIDERPTTRKFVRIPTGGSFGIEFSHGSVLKIVPNSAADKVGVLVGDVLSQVGNYCTLGMPDHLIFNTIARAKAAAVKSGEVYLVFMRPAFAKELILGCEMSMNSLQMKMVAPYVFADQSLALDHHLEGAEIEKIFLESPSEKTTQTTVTTVTTGFGFSKKIVKGPSASMANPRTSFGYAHIQETARNSVAGTGRSYNNARLSNAMESKTRENTASRASLGACTSGARLSINATNLVYQPSPLISPNSRLNNIIESASGNVESSSTERAPSPLGNINPGSRLSLQGTARNTTSPPRTAPGNTSLGSLPRQGSTPIANDEVGKDLLVAQRMLSVKGTLMRHKKPSQDNNQIVPQNFSLKSLVANWF